MTNPDDRALPPVPPEIATVSAFLDGERVNAQQLKSALRHQDASDFLVDGLVLRHCVLDAAVVPETAVRPRRMNVLRYVAAVLIVGAASLTAYVLGQRSTAGAAVPSGRMEAVAELAPRAPEPTQVIRLTPEGR